MKINDYIYGEYEIEDILEEIILTDEFIRLKNIYQGGGSHLVNPKWNVTRYEHSLGTMILIRMLGGTIEEQIAGLLHDISHTAFSHVIDFVLKNENEDYHEKIFKDVIENSKIPKILEKYGFNYEDILFNEEKWTILERKAPKLCADRVDYTLRDLYKAELISKYEIDKFLGNLDVENGEIVIKSIEIGEWFVQAYYKEVIDYFMNPINIFGNDILSKAIKEGMKLGEIKEEDFLRDDLYLLEKLNNSKFETVSKLMNTLKKIPKLEENKNEFDLHIKNKVRIIDPTIFLDNSIFSLSEKSEISKVKTENAIKKLREGIFIKIIK